MIDLQTISIMIAATGVTIAAVYYVLILRSQNARAPAIVPSVAWVVRPAVCGP